MNTPADASLPDLTLCDLPLETTATITQVRTPATPDERHLVLRLLEIGFLPGEEVRVVAHGHPGREPIAIRLGHTTFALRRFEAEFVRVKVETEVGAKAVAA